MLIVISLMVFGGCQWIQDEIRRPTHYSLPEGYAGWVEIVHEVEGAPPLPIENGHYVVRIGSDGRLATSSPMDYGTPLWGRDVYCYRESNEPITGDAHASRVGYWRHTVGTKTDYRGAERPTHRTFQQFFVGTKEEWEGWQGGPVIGPLEQLKMKSGGKSR